MLADHGLKHVVARALLGRRPRRPIRRRRSASSCRSSTASRPTTSRSSPRPTSWATAWRGRAEAPARVELPGRGLGPDARRPGRPHRPRHRPLRGPEDAGGPGGAARLPGAAVRRRGQALPAGREHRPADPLRRRERGRAARPAGRRGLAGAQGQGQGAPARDGRGPDPIAASAPAARSTDEIDPPHGLFDEFCARFPYEETDDQLNAIGDVLDGPGSGQADGPADLRRRRLRQDRGGAARRLRRGHERPAGGRGLPDDPAGPPALQDLHRALRRLAGQGAPPVAPGPRQGGRRDPRGPEERRVRDRRRHPRGAVASRSGSRTSAWSSSTRSSTSGSSTRRS